MTNSDPPSELVVVALGLIIVTTFPVRTQNSEKSSNLPEGTQLSAEQGFASAL